MENINKDILVSIALELNYIDILKFCQLSKRIDKYVCKNNYFWMNKLHLDYPYLRNYKFDNYSGAYKMLKTVRAKKLNNYERIGVINSNFIEFLLNSNLGLTKKYNISINTLLNPIIKQHILNREIAMKLLFLYLIRNNLGYKIDNITYFTTDEKLDQYLDTLKLFTTNRNKLTRNDIKIIAEKSFIPNNSTNDPLNISKSRDIMNYLSKLEQIL